MTGLLAHGVWLALVLGHSGVYDPALLSACLTSSPRFFGMLVCVLDDVRTDWGLEDLRQRVCGPTGGAIGRSDRHCRTSRHLDVVVVDGVDE